YKDYRLAAIDVSLEPRIAEQDALETVLKDSGKESEAIKENKVRLILFRDSGKETHLAWEIEWIGEGDLAASFHIIDAHSGSILLKHTRMRGVISRLTYSAENSMDLKAKLMARDDQSTTDNVAQAAHDHAETVYNYFYNTFGRDSYDGQGADLVSTVHYKQNYNNAYWTDWYRQMVYGDGDGYRFDPLALALDVVGHELTHAVSSRTARFVYAEEAGALDESFADFFGVMVSNEGEITDWKMGEGVYTPFRSGDALRDLSDPARYGQPDHMNDFMALEPGEQPDPDKNDNGYVHSNSGIPNKAAYLTVAGGTYHGITVEGIGREKAEQIYYLAMTSYLSSATDSRWTFMQAIYALLNACRQLYGDNSSEYAAVKNAWATVGIGEPADTFAIIRKESSPNLAIPDKDVAGVESVLHVEEEGLLKDISIGIVIEHTYIGDLRVVLTSPSGESVVLHDREGRSTRDITKTYDLNSDPRLSTFVGDGVQGDWVLSVSDHARVDTGKLLYWELVLSTQKAEKKELTKEATPNQHIPDNDPTGIESIIETQESGRIVRLDVPIDISHTWIGDLRVLLVSPSGTEVVLHDRSGRSRHDINKIYSTTTDEPMSVLLGSEIQGIWQLKVVDTYSRDIGTLNSWGIHCVYE
ncbi:MAG: M4 family metallopeptidase, partial [Desulfobulbaceae bacterium]|nr:M4 family metallopeptidase [Desulfobulbaceae bacterium]